jgi:hypothetical protein
MPFDALRMQRICSAALLAVFAIAEFFSCCVEIVRRFDSQRYRMQWLLFAPLGYTLANDVAKLSVRVLPLLFTQTGLHDASALLCELPSDFAKVRAVLVASVQQNVQSCVTACQLTTSSAHEILTIS